MQIILLPLVVVHWLSRPCLSEGGLQSESGIDLLVNDFVNVADVGVGVSSTSAGPLIEDSVSSPNTGTATDEVVSASTTVVESISESNSQLATIQFIRDTTPTPTIHITVLGGTDVNTNSSPVIPRPTQPNRRPKYPKRLVPGINVSATRPSPSLRPTEIPFVSSINSTPRKSFRPTSFSSTMPIVITTSLSEASTYQRKGTGNEHSGDMRDKFMEESTNGDSGGWTSSTATPGGVVNISTIPESYVRTTLRSIKPESTDGRTVSKRADIFDMFDMLDENILTPAKKMFKKSGGNLPGKAAEVLQSIDEMLYKGKQLLSLERLSENDAMRLLDRMSHLPRQVIDRLATVDGLTVEDIRGIPADIIAALDDDALSALGNWSGDRVGALCGRMVRVTSCPRNLKRALDHGVDCQNMFDIIHEDLETVDVSTGYLLMEKLQSSKPAISWQGDFLNKVIQTLGPALPADVIEEISVTELKKSVANISLVDFPLQSQWRSLMRRISSQSPTPNAWSLPFLKEMVPLLRHMELGSFKLIHTPWFLDTDVLLELNKVNMERGPIKIALVRNMVDSLRNMPGPEQLALILKWVKSDVSFMNGLTTDVIMDALDMASNVTFTDSEVDMTAERLEEFPRFVDHIHSMNVSFGGNITSIAKTVRKLLCGFSEEFLDKFPLKVLSSIVQVHGKPVRCPGKARKLLEYVRMANSSLQNIRLPPHLVYGLRLADVDGLHMEEAMEVLDMLKDEVHVPEHFTTRLIKKVIPSWSHETMNGLPCNRLFHRLGKSARLLSISMIREAGIIPISLNETKCSHSKIELTRLTKAQAMAVVSNVREALAISAEEAPSSLWSAQAVNNLGSLVRGLTAADIRSLPLDTELLTTMEILGKYEDELDSSQTEAITDKIRQYFDIVNRNTIDNADSITIKQIGRFLQYLNPEFELSKFPVQLRPVMAVEMGVSRHTKIMARKRQQLLHFSLKNRPGGVDASEGEITADHLLDLGHLVCGLTQDQIKRLTADAVEIHLEQLEKCPLLEQEAQTLAKRAVDLNMSRLKAREDISTMGSLLLHLDENDVDQLSQGEIALISDYISSSIDAHSQEFDERRKGGFIREMTSSGTSRLHEKTTALGRKLHQSMKSTFGQNKCHQVVRLGKAATTMAAQLDKAQLTRCLDFFRSLDWTAETASEVISKMRMDGIMDANRTEADYLLERAPELLSGLGAEFINSLDLNDEDTLATLGGVRNLPNSHKTAGFSHWVAQRKVSGPVRVEEVELLGGLVCGAEPSGVELGSPTYIPGDVIRIHLSKFGRCKGEVLKAFAANLMEDLDNDTRSLDPAMIVEMEGLLGGLTAKQLQSLTTSQLKSIAPHVISDMDPLHLKEFTASQLSDLTAVQVQATTNMQRSYMTQEQTDAMGISPFTSHAGMPVQSSQALLVIVLAMSLFTARFTS